MDFAHLAALAREYRPKLIIAGASAYPRSLDFEKFAEISQEWRLISWWTWPTSPGLVATGLHPNPVPTADFVTSTTHKTLRGPRGGLILAPEKFARLLDSQIFPGIQGGPLMHVIAAKAVAQKRPWPVARALRS